MNPLALIIDDEVQIRRLLRVALESSGYGVCEADQGQLGLAEAALRRPDVILLERLRRHHARRRVRLHMTGRVIEGKRSRACPGERWRASDGGHAVR